MKRHKRSRDRKENGKCTNATNRRSRVGLPTNFTLIWSSTMLFSGATTKMHVFGFEASFTSQNNWKIRLFPKPVGKIEITSRPEIRAFRVSIFGKRNKHSSSASAIINLSVISIVDSLLSTLHAFLRCEANAYFIDSGCAGSLSFIFSGCRPPFSRLPALSHARD